MTHTNTDVTADLEGKFRLTMNGPTDSLAVSALGFGLGCRKLGTNRQQMLLFRLKQGGGVALGEAVAVVDSRHG